MSGREIVLGRVRNALADARPVAPVPRVYAEAGSLPRAEVVSAFVQRVRDYRATVVVAGDVRAAIGEALGAGRIGIPADLPQEIRPSGADLIADEELSPRQLDRLDGALTTCAAACAVTGTIALDGGPGQGRRLLTLLPDLHVCVVREEQNVETVPELVRRLEPAAAEGRPIVLVSGPSATSDIELERVEGVHGPRRLVVIVER